jgi:hypothetical protein
MLRGYLLVSKKDNAVFSKGLVDIVKNRVINILTKIDADNFGTEMLRTRLDIKRCIQLRSNIIRPPKKAVVVA